MEWREWQRAKDVKDPPAHNTWNWWFGIQGELEVALWSPGTCLSLRESQCPRRRVWKFTKVSLPTGATGSLCWSFGWLDFVVFVFGIHSRRNTLIWWVFFFLFRLGQRRQTRGDGAVEVTHGVKDIRHTLTKHLNASVWWSNSKDQVGWNRQTKPNSYKIKDDRRRHRHMSRLPRRRKRNRVERKKRDQMTKDISDKRLRTRDQRGTHRKKKRRQTIHRQNWGLKF